MTALARILWRRLDRPGHDAARIIRTDTGWRIEGMAVGPRTLTYAIDANVGWRTIRAEVRGWGPDGDLGLKVERSMMGGWMVDGTPRPDLGACEDIDLGFTPATNTLPLRRLDLAVGREATVSALWLVEDAWEIRPLAQSYSRKSASTYRYASENADVTLTVSEAGLVTDYPGGWLAELGTAG